MNTSFYKNEAKTLQSIFEKFKTIQSSTESDGSYTTNAPSNLSKDALIVAIILFLFIIGMVGFLTVWLVN